MKNLLSKTPLKKAVSLVVILGIGLTLLTACQLLPRDSASAVVSEQLFNDHWQFYKTTEQTTLSQVPSFTGWEPVSLPHTANIEPLLVNDQWQGDAWYRKSFRVASDWQGRHAYLRFEGAMNVAEVWLNGQKLAHHLGGYLPFTVYLNPALNNHEENELLVRLDNRDNPITGPKPLEILDFNMYGGLYRNVVLSLKNDLHITDPVYANKVASGGLFVTYPQVSAEQARVRVQTHLRNKSDQTQDYRVTQRLLRDGREVAQARSAAMTLAAGGDSENALELRVRQPALWSPQSPALYDLVTQVFSGNQLVDEQHTRIGIRELRVQQDGVYINGQKQFLRGVNRHQEYPYVGYALSDAAQYRDALKIKSAGFDYIRLSHYPHSPAFMAAADELGLIVLNAILGWQFINEDPAFTEQVLQTCRDLIRRDRNHPSVLAWECSLNETWMPESLIDQFHAIVLEEFPSPTTYSAGWQEYGYDIYLEARQHRLDHDHVSEKPYFVSEYGDWEYYAMNAGLAQDTWADLLQADRSSRQLLADGEVRLLQQATNIQEAHNDNYTTTAIADSYWVMYDYNRGYAEDLEASGIMSIHRLPKFSYYFFQSQRDPGERSEVWAAGPMVHIASWWTEASPLSVRVFSNAEQVELFLNGTSLGRQAPDRNDIAHKLPHPPFTFKLEQFVPGSLRALAYIDGKVVAEHQVHTPGAPQRLVLSLDESGRAPQAGVNDVVFVHAQVVDARGNPVRSHNLPVEFVLEGDAQVLNPEPIVTEAGIASALVRIGARLEGLSIRAQSADGQLQSEPLRY